MNLSVLYFGLHFLGYLLGVTISLVNLRRLGLPAVLCLIGCGVNAAVFSVYSFGHDFLNSGTDASHYMNYALTSLDVATWALLIVAVFNGRKAASLSSGAGYSPSASLQSTDG